MALKSRSPNPRSGRAEHILDRSLSRNSHAENAHFLQSRLSRRHSKGLGRTYYDDKVACRAGGCGWDGGGRKSSSIIRGEDIKQIECGSTRSLVYNDINALAWARVDVLSSARVCARAYVRACVGACMRACGLDAFHAISRRVCTRASARRRVVQKTLSLTT